MDTMSEDRCNLDYLRSLLNGFERGDLHFGALGAQLRYCSRSDLFTRELRDGLFDIGGDLEQVYAVTLDGGADGLTPEAQAIINSAVDRLRVLVS